jgi:hypothetical protein
VTSILDRYKMRRIHWMTAVFMAMNVPQPSEAMEPDASVSIAAGASKWVAYETAGRVFASLPPGDQVVGYDSGGKDVMQFQVGVTPTEMKRSGDRLIVACRLE